MKEIAQLTPDEPIRVNARRLDDIVQGLGESAAGEVIGLAVEQLAVTLGELRRAVADDDIALARRQADHLARVAWQIGLVSLTSVALDVADCLDRQDRPAQSATLGRLSRIARRSLTELWDHTDPLIWDSS